MKAGLVPVFAFPSLLPLNLKPKTMIQHIHLVLLAIALSFLVCKKPVHGQTVNGDAFALGNGCFQLTTALANQAGSVYFPDTLNLNQPFTLLLQLNFGNRNTDGADGIAFVMHPHGPTQLGGHGRALGWSGIPNSLGIEFDTYPNFSLGDPQYDHIAVFRDGNNDHGLPAQLWGPVPALPGQGNVEDSLDHLIRISWEPGGQLLEVDFDCVNRVSMPIDLVQSIFGGDSIVRWGLSAGTAHFFNVQGFCILSGQIGEVQDSVLMCKGDTAQFAASPSRDGLYSWQPAFHIDHPAAATVEVWPDQDTVYTVSYTTPCGFRATDTFLIRLHPETVVELGHDTVGCEGDTLTLDPGLSDGLFLWSTGSTDSIIQVHLSGKYALSYRDRFGCGYSDSVELDFVFPPVVEAGRDIHDCDPEAVHELSALPLLPQTLHVWSTGDTSATLNVSTTGTYIVQAINGCATASDTVNVFIYQHPEGFFIPNVFSPNGDGINDEFRVEHFRHKEFWCQVVDRWGRLVFETQTNGVGWDGRIDGHPAPVGTYFYRVRIRDCEGFPADRIGSLILIR